MNEKSEEIAFDETREILLNLSKQDFLSFGMRDLAYIRPVIVEDRRTVFLYPWRRIFQGLSARLPITIFRRLPCIRASLF